MARISERDAERLGIGRPQKDKGDKRRTAIAPVKRDAALGTKRRSSKGGRIARAAEARPFDVSFFVPLEPKTKERPRTSLSKSEIERAFLQSGGSPARFKALLDGIKHRTFTPDGTADFEEAVGRIAAASMRGGKDPYESPVHVDFVFVMTGTDEHWPTDVTDPDLDNMEKAICDALNKVVWKDDRLMVSKRSIKLCGPTSGIAVRIRAADAPDAALMALLKAHAR